MHKGFDHDKFAADCSTCSMPQLVSYNSDQLVKDRFTDWNAAEFDLTYTMRSVGEYMRDQKSRKELCFLIMKKKVFSVRMTYDDMNLVYQKLQQSDISDEDLKH